MANYIQARDTMVEAKISSGERDGHMASRIAVQRGKVSGKESPAQCLSISSVSCLLSGTQDPLG